MHMETPFMIEFEEANPKYLQIVDAVIDAIRTRKLQRGQRVPSINELSEEFLLSRDTVEKAYRELRRRGIITSVKGKGYFINRTDIQAQLRVMLLFNKISNYKNKSTTASCAAWANRPRLTCISIISMPIFSSHWCKMHSDYTIITW